MRVPCVQTPLICFVFFGQIFGLGIEKAKLYTLCFETALSNFSQSWSVIAQILDFCKQMPYFLSRYSFFVTKICAISWLIHFCRQILSLLFTHILSHFFEAKKQSCMSSCWSSVYHTITSTIIISCTIFLIIWWWRSSS